MRKYLFLFIALTWAANAQQIVQVTGVELTKARAVLIDTLNSPDGIDWLITQVFKTGLNSATLPQGPTDEIQVPLAAYKKWLSMAPDERSVILRSVWRNGKFAIVSGQPNRTWVVTYPILKRDASLIAKRPAEADIIVQSVERLNQRAAGTMPDLFKPDE